MQTIKALVTKYPQLMSKLEAQRRQQKRRLETFNRILENALATFSAPQLRVALRTLIAIDTNGDMGTVATHYAGEEENSRQSAGEILFAVTDRLEDSQLPKLVLRLISTTLTDNPRKSAIDHLA